MEIYRTFKRYEDAGCFAVEIECVAEKTLALLNEKTSIVTFSLGSGHATERAPNRPNPRHRAIAWGISILI